MKNQIKNPSFSQATNGTSYNSFTDGVLTATLDNWNLQQSAGGGTAPTLTVTQQRFPLTGALVLPEMRYFMRVANGTAGASLGVNSYTRLVTRLADAAVLAGKICSFSFYCKDGVANRQIAVEIIQNFGTGGSPSSAVAVTQQGILADSSLGRKTISFVMPSVVGKTFGSGNDSYVEVRIYLQAGTGLAASTGVSQITWPAASGTFEISDVQIEGTFSTTDFEDPFTAALMVLGTAAASPASQAEVDAGTNSTKFVAPSTLANRALPTGFIRKGLAGIESNFEAILNKEIAVSQSTGTDTRTGLSKYNSMMPFATPTAAQTAAAAGDFIRVKDGTFTDKNLGKDQVNWYFSAGSGLSLTAALTTGDYFFGDGGGAISFSVLGDGTFLLANTGANVQADILNSHGTGSSIYFEYMNATINQGGGQDYTIGRCAGPSQQIIVSKGTTTNTKGTAFMTRDSAGALQYVDVNIVVATGQTGFFALSGTQYFKFKTFAGADIVIVAGAGTKQVGEFLEGTFTDEGIKGGAGDQYVQFKRISSSTNGTYGVDGASTGGTQHITGQEVILTGTGDCRGVTARGAGKNYWNIQRVTAPKVGIFADGDTTINYGEYNGNDALAAFAITNSGNSAKLRINNARFTNVGAGSLLDQADATAKVILDGTVMITANTNSMTGSGNVVVLSNYSNKAVTGITEQVNATKVDTNIA